MTHRKIDDKNPPTWAGVAPLRYHLGFAAGVILVFIVSGLVT